MTTPITLTLTPYVVVWRFQGDVTDGILTNTTVEIFLETAYKDGNGTVFKNEPLTTIKGTVTELNFLDEFTSIQTKLNAIIATMQPS